METNDQSKYCRTFELTDEKAHKFWEVSCDDCEMTTRWGRIGSSGQSKTKTFKTAADTIAAAEKVVGQKTKKGYTETTPADVSQPDDASPAPQTLNDPATTENAEQTLGDVFEQMLAPAMPQSLTLVPAGMSVFETTSALGQATIEALETGFEPCGDFLIRELNVVVLGLFHAPGTFAALCQLEDVEWIDICIFNEDGTHENWSSQAMHDGRVPPWATLNLMPGSSIQQLLAASGQHSGKTHAQLSGDQFAHIFADSYAREMEWRNSNPANTDLFSQLINHISADAADEEDDVDESCEAPEGLSETDSRAFRLLRLVKNSFSFYGCLDLSEIGLLEKSHKKIPLSERGLQYVREARAEALKTPLMMQMDDTASAVRLDALLGEADTRVPLAAGEIWADTVTTDLNAMNDQQRIAWLRLFRHCILGSASKPSAKWKKEAESLLDRITDFYDRINEWLPLIGKPKPATDHDRFWDHPYFLREGNQLVLRGLVWCCGLRANDQLPALLTTIALSAYRKIPHQGERATKVGNACVLMIGASDHPDAVSMLAIIKTKARTKTTRNSVNKQLDKTAERLGVSRAELEEMSVPAFGLQQVGVLHEQLGDFTAELEVGTKSCVLQWRKSDGKLQKSVPAAVKRDFTDELKELKAAAKEIDKMLSVQKRRIESLYLEQRSWSFKDWRERYADHPLIGTVARRLLWNFTTGDECTTAIWTDTNFCDIDGNKVTVADDAQVTLWHPIDEPAATVAIWRQRVEDATFSQPFKQAHRELYVLTDAERQTQTYSNRFGAHILKQSQYRSLAQTRQWEVNYLGPWDGGDEGIATRDMPQFNSKAQFRVNGAMADEDDYGFSYVTTDQVRFYLNDNSDAPTNLADVPPVLFSEIMRDVDLFVGVASVGNDPNWSDGGPEGQFQDYWTSYSFGELSATAITRRAVLERLLPRLKIADRCELKDRFLRVQGSLRAYRIHLGSGNILMEPNDQYLCIVTGRTNSAAEKLSLPFEGDHMFSIILSKAFLLADDAKIKDSSITSQIRSS